MAFVITMFKPSTLLDSTCWLCENSIHLLDSPSNYAILVYWTYLKIYFIC